MVLDLSDYVCTSQTAAILGVSEARVRQLVKSEKLDCVRTPLGRLFSRADVEAYAATRRAA